MRKQAKISDALHPRRVPGQAKSKYEYVKQFEQDDTLLRGCWIVVRIDGKVFTKCVERGCTFNFPDKQCST